MIIIIQKCGTVFLEEKISVSTGFSKQWCSAMFSNVTSYNMLANHFRFNHIEWIMQQHMICQQITNDSEDIPYPPLDFQN